MNSLHKYRWLLFDADGTLFDYDRAEDFALESAFRSFSLPFEVASAEAYRQINRQIWLDFENGQITAELLRVRRFERLFDRLALKADPAAFSQRYLLHLSQASDLMPGAEALIRQLAGRYHLGLITNGLHDVQRPRLARSPIADDFKLVAVSEEMGVAKPDPRFFDEVFASIGQPLKDSVLIIGDSLTSDIQGGINYGLDTCWFNPAGKPPDPNLPATYEIHRLEELVSLLL